MKSRVLWGVFFLAVSGILIVRNSGAMHVGSFAEVEKSDESRRSSLGNETRSWTVRISPYGTQNKVLDFLASTRYELVGWQYQITEKDVWTVLKNVSQLGKRIRVVLENKTFGDSSKEYDTFVQNVEPAWVEVISDDALGTVYVHAKTRIADRERFLISTANLSYTSFRRNREYRITGVHTWIAMSLYTMFEKDRRDEPLEQMDVHPLLVMCPIDCREKIMEALRRAKQSIDIQAQYLEDPAIVHLLEEKMKTVAVRIIVGEHQDIHDLGGLSLLTKVLKEPYVHAKNIVIDATRMIAGSMNLSQNALDNNREIGIILHDSTMIRSFMRQFERDREAAEFIAL